MDHAEMERNCFRLRVDWNNFTEGEYSGTFGVENPQHGASLGGITFDVNNPQSQALWNSGSKRFRRR